MTRLGFGLLFMFLLTACGAGQESGKLFLQCLTVLFQAKRRWRLVLLQMQKEKVIRNMLIRVLGEILAAPLVQLALQGEKGVTSQ